MYGVQPSAIAKAQSVKIIYINGITISLTPPMMLYRERLGGNTTAASCNAAVDIIMVARAETGSSLNASEAGWKGS